MRSRRLNAFATARGLAWYLLARMPWLDSITVFGGVGLAVGLALAIVATLAVGTERRRAIPGWLLLTLYVGTVLGHGLFDDEHLAHQWLRHVGLMLLLLSCTRSVYLILLRTLFRWIFGPSVPRIVGDLIQALLYASAGLFTLQTAGVDPGDLLTTSALLTAVVGLSLQDTLGNLFSGLAMQAQRPFQMGDWIQFDANDRHIGKVVDINWRAIRVRTIDGTDITVPNNTLAKTPLKNFTANPVHARRTVSIYGDPTLAPEKVRRVLQAMLHSVPGVRSAPEPSVVVAEFDERGVRYDARFYIEAFEHRDRVASEVRERAWYALSRAGISISVPHRSIEVRNAQSHDAAPQEEARVRARMKALDCVDFLAVLSEAQRKRLGELSDTRLYAPGEAILREGDAGEALYVLLSGKVEVRKGEPSRKLAELGPGRFFGEMSLMTGASRSATVIALEETALLEIGKPALAPILESEPKLCQALSEVLAEREQRQSDANARQTLAEIADEKDALLSRIRRFFSLR